jgi:hypothetical protein
MRNPSKAEKTRNEDKWPRATPRMSYQKLAGWLASEMAESIRSNEPRQFCAPFDLVIVDARGAVVFECEVGGDWKVSQEGPERIVRRSHFPATALLTDRSLLTRTFQIEREL